jgi:hypothetical protein
MLFNKVTCNYSLFHHHHIFLSGRRGHEHQEQEPTKRVELVIRGTSWWCGVNQYLVKIHRSGLCHTRLFKATPRQWTSRSFQPRPGHTLLSVTFNESKGISHNLLTILGWCLKQRNRKRAADECGHLLILVS